MCVNKLIEQIDEVFELYCVPPEEKDFLLGGKTQEDFEARLDELFELYCIYPDERPALISAYTASHTTA